MPRQVTRDNLTVLKFGGSVLAREHDLASAVHEIYRWVRAGQRVVAVVSALGKTTDKLLAQAHQYGSAPEPAALASLVATGELSSAALLGLALDRAGLPAEVLDAARISLRTSGPILDSEPVSVDIGAVLNALDRASVVVVPGFLGRDDAGRTTLLGRGGSDFTALFLAHALGAGRCRLVKDVKGLYERDPARPGPLARIFRSLSWDDALRLDGRIVQHKAVRWAKDRQLEFEVAALNGTEASSVGPFNVRLGPAENETPPPLRIGLLGLGTVGGGVWRALSAHPEQFEITKVGVRSVKRAADNGVPAYLLTDDPASVVRSACDVVIELIGGEEPAHSLIRQALESGKHVVTANKAVIARWGPELQRLAEERGVSLRFAGAVGGAVPILETIERLASGEGIESIEAILNGTTNFVLDRVREGVAFDEAVRAAQAAGFAEADPTRDLDGTDAAEKLVILTRAAFGASPLADGVERRGIIGLPAPEKGGAIRLIATAWLDPQHRPVLNVAPHTLPPRHPLADTPNELNRAIIRTKAGRDVIVHGKGAGRWPTTEAVFADLLALARERASTLPTLAPPGASRRRALATEPA
jgi:homoserine dehydrogenase